jgi:uncharacterized membrane protein HdeD (DUF308 family)
LIALCLSPVTNARLIYRTVIGVVLFCLGLFIAVRPLFTHNGILTSARWLDFTFAAVFMLRGAVNIKTAQRQRAQG